ncbi:alpha-2,8-polysialyltransferase family protein [Streptomyces sp. 35G-GA-8]|uniref:alpha-2,8-polysialyltransferase family protein n=1 Tax=Streptomyces sp. 35G-GA-8 TaxID=2939434 RepID=UPI00201EED97|nr:alpha-2,8-polysialyltransferase family protein [Streptomyces sp. 35G-GA-8]MCL7376170.1 alpha-2,8-polysialyltransferase family protein [Streptomyces sp. 35G-GA-8]
MAGTSTTQLFFAATQYAAATVTAALRAGQFGARDDHRRILVVSDVSASPELGKPFNELPGFGCLRPEFDEVRSWNEFIRPFHPAGWAPREQDAPLWQRAVREAWNLGDEPVEIACESIQANPSQAVAMIFGESPIHVYADGLMSYGPTRSKLDPLIGGRVERLLHLDLVPGLKPLLLTEFGVEPEIVPTDTFVKVLAELADATVDPVTDVLADSEPPALLLGQYLSMLDILTAREEEELHVLMLRGAVARGHKNIVFKPHPSAPAHWSRRLEEEADRLGAQLTVRSGPVLAEVLYQRLNPALVVACFSTALFTAATFYDLPVARAGTEMLLERLTPYQNSNRVPVTIVDALLAPLEETDPKHQPDEQLGDLVATVGFAMQPQIYPGLRPRAERYLSKHLTSRTLKYFKRRRLTALALPGGVPAQLAFIPRNATVRRVVRRARSFKKTALG